MDVPVYYEEVSLRLVRVLDTSGLGEKARRKRNEMGIQFEQLQTVASAYYKITSHIFGSQAEATTTVGLRSDLDIVYRCDAFTVLQDLQSWVPGSRTLLMITDDTTPPGYVKLQGVYNDTPIPVCNLQTDTLMLDRYGRSVLYNTHRSFKQDSADLHHGPANTYYLLADGSDIVTAFRDLSWPHTASEWIIRRRNHNWPSQETVSTIQQSGTLLVPVGQQLSPDKHLEWRISLSYGEKILVWQFNSSQYKCYVLLKMINKYFIKPKVGDNVLTSYHCKTCMFYMIEGTPATLWQPQNLLICIELCLRKLCTMVEGGNCPNYFIPSENMFLGKVYGPIQSNLANVLHDLIRQKGKYLTRIPCDGIGLKLIRVCQSPLVEIDDENIDSVMSVTQTVAFLVTELRETWFRVLDNDVLINSRILNMTSSHGIRQEANTILRTFCCSSFGSHLASKCLEQDVIDQEGLDLAQELLLLGSCSDVASGKLKLAAFHLMLNNVISAENILQNIEENYTFLVSNVRTENNKSNVQTVPIKYLSLLRIVNENLSTTEVVRYYFAFPVPYLPSEIRFTPRALIPEMFRSTGSYEGSLDPEVDYWQTWTVVDPKFYLHFLEYQCYHQQNRIPQKRVALDNMIWVIRYDKLEYKDTALNLLSYCLKKEGLLVQAYKVVSKSMKLQNHHNAAKWQIACLINAAFRWLGARR